MQAVSHLLYWDSGFNSLNHRNLEGQTQGNDREIRVMLICGFLFLHSIVCKISKAQYLYSMIILLVPEQFIRYPVFALNLSLWACYSWSVVAIITYSLDLMELNVCISNVFQLFFFFFFFYLGAACA